VDFMTDHQALRTRVVASLLITASFTPTLSHCQDAPFRTGLSQLRATLDSETTPYGVDAAATRWDSTTAGTIRRLGDSYILLRRGLVANDRRLLESAWSGFDAIVQVHPDWPYARLGLAISSLEISRRGYTVPPIWDGSPGLSHYDGAAVQLQRLLQEEPQFTPALDWMAASLLTAEGDREQPEGLMRALGNALDSNQVVDPRLQLIVARSERIDGDPAQSIARIKAYLHQGGDTGIADFELARSLAALDSLARGATLYLTGAWIATPATREIYRLDLTWIATPGELDRFDAIAPDSVGAFVARFWSLRDAREFTTPGARLQEHLRRWAYINQHFRVADAGASRIVRQVHITNPNEFCANGGKMSLEDYEFVRPGPPQDYRANEYIFDHRAIVYMRHGEPLYQFGGDTASIHAAATDRNGGSPSVMDQHDPVAARSREMMGGGAETSVDASLMVPTLATGSARIPPSRLTTPDLDRNMTWVYMMEGQLRTFTFYGHSALGTAHATTLFVYAPPNLDVLLQLSAAAPQYARLANVVEAYQSGYGGLLPLTCRQEYRSVVEQQRRDADVAVHSDSYLQMFARPIETAVQVAAIGQPALGTGLLVTAIGLRLKDLVPSDIAGDPDHVAYVVRVRIAAMDSLSGEVSTSDSVRRFVAPRTQSGWAVLIATVPLQRAMQTARIAVQQGADRGNTSAASIEPAGAAFAASDLVLGSPGEPGRWHRDGDEVPITPFSSYLTGTALDVYQELYGLIPGGKYRTSISLLRVGDKKAQSTLTFMDEPVSKSLASTRQITLDRVKPGSYQLRVEVEELSSGHKVQRTRDLEVTSP
jgi:hypothetical protein